MADDLVHLKPVFLSASIPDPRRNPKYFESGDAIAIRDATIALVTVVLSNKGRLVFGGHPAITPMVKWVADQLGEFDRVRMFQSTYYRKDYLKDIERFRYREIEEVAGNEEESLEKMRKAMLASEDFGTAFFIGGMEGVEREHDLLIAKDSSVPRFPVATTGAAAQRLWEHESARCHNLPARQQVHRREQLERLRTKTSYVALFTSLLEEPERRG